MKVILILFVLFSCGYCKIEFSDRARNFSVELLYYTAEEINWHTVISPFGIWSLITGISLGATGTSREQLMTTLILPKKKENLVNGYQSLTTAVLNSNTGAVELKNRNYLFSDSDFFIKKDFINELRNNFKTIPTKLNFKPPQSAAKIANEVIKKYGMAVSNVLKPDDFENSRMILTNVITFKGFWQTPFNETLTNVEPFYNENGLQTGEVNMMHLEGSFSYSTFEEIESTILELPYGNEESSKYTFVVLLPYKGVPVSTVYKKLSIVNLKDIILKLQNDTDMYGTIEVIISLPRFKISTNVVLNRPLNKMGLSDIFDPSAASFGKITDSNNIFVSSIVHKADIEVTEKGTIASASTSSYFSDRMMPANFNANRPFIYFIMEKTTNTIIFSGVYSKPSIF
ncbi:PREDICTED: serine protease inhibitor 2.1-like [Papilio xuthus]|uniref:Serine protease inhibitor 2.1-like n=2 Tax=Papilio xuthus TaxID=66420 RepID=A0A0N1I9J2_PAPXU|nr:PREDICTED: serine protease inhibitor 2.1-like [Papilio xuthus]KPJ00033.1 Serpin B9 [Papilio xuthus]